MGLVEKTSDAGRRNTAGRDHNTAIELFDRKHEAEKDPIGSNRFKEQIRPTKKI